MLGAESRNLNHCPRSVFLERSRRHALRHASSAQPNGQALTSPLDVRIFC